MTTSEMFARSTSFGLAQLLFETCWVAVGFIFYFLLEVYFVPQARQIFLSAVRVKLKTRELEAEDEGGSTKSSAAAAELATKQELGIPEEQHDDGLSQRREAPPERPASGAVVSKSTEVAALQQQETAALLNECRPLVVPQSRRFFSGVVGRRGGGGSFCGTRGGGFLEHRRKERLGYVQEFHPYQDPAAARAAKAATSELQAITTEKSTPQISRGVVPPTSEGVPLLQLWKEAMAIPCPPQSPGSKTSPV